MFKNNSHEPDPATRNFILICLYYFFSGDTYVNILSTERGTTCNASSLFSSTYTCEKCYDGDTSTAFSALNFKTADGEWNWLELSFKEAYTIVRASFVLGRYSVNRMKEIEVMFDDNSNRTVCQGGLNTKYRNYIDIFYYYL